MDRRAPETKRADYSLAVRAISAFTVALALWAGSAAAQPRRATLGWVRLPGAEACPPAPDVARAIEERLGRSVLVAAGDAELSIEGRVERAGTGWSATIRVADAAGAIVGERTLSVEGEDCAPILGPVALSIALAIDPDASAAPEGAEPPATPTTSETVIESRMLRVVAPRWRLELSLSASAALGLLPFAAPGGTFALFLTPPGFVPLVAQGMLYPWSRAELGGGEWIDHLAALGGIGICPIAVRDPAISFLACAGVDAGARVAIGRSTQPPDESQRVVVQIDVAARAHLRIAGPLYASAALSLFVPFPDDRWSRAGATYWSPLLVAGALDLGLGLDLDL
jgi:hypothetical protein